MTKILEHDGKTIIQTEKRIDTINAPQFERDISEVLAQNDAYHALKAVDGLIITGPTGTNVNDVAVALFSK